MNASEIIKLCKGKGLNGVPKCSLVSNCLPPEPINQRLTEEQLSPPVPSYHVNSRTDAFHPKLQRTCLDCPVAVIRNLTATLEINLDLYSTKTLVETRPNTKIDIREQRRYAFDENWDEERRKKNWACTSKMSYMTISKYAKYQTDRLLEEDQTLLEENRNPNLSTFDGPDKVTERNKTVKFATNVDLSKPCWKPQLNELTKLPSLFKVECADNMLSYMCRDLLGMNTVQLYMKVPGCRTTGHQENNNFCSVNINIGPGDCEWFAAPHEYWGVINSLCERNGVDYLRDPWWPPNLDVLRENNVPVYRFVQKPGDIVWVNVGCVHWVHAIGCCNNIAWNVGPFTVKQYQTAIERYEWNKLRQYLSIVPMVELSWNLARKAKVSNQLLYQLIKNCLSNTMKQNYLTLELIESKGLTVKKYADECENDETAYCEDCAAEIFNIIICKRKSKKTKTHLVYCLDCALKQSTSLENFVFLEKCCMENLMNIYDKFVCY
ncbi:PREDICTED: histone demethylase UTY-like isoform X1 [Wasmannia auropunctata]|uniref:histone demethylase UTY-like isoform X1 n=1 Tax=Wasmannia auropunctata TaxID=64793 RepID=UPI0005EFFAB3|nr:PREDICTED: histone demethylase UTY-like isoform X1 [Wasmannia auropunctata]